MSDDFDYKVLVNAEGQYSLWPEMKAIPEGWQQTGPTGSKQDALDWIANNWNLGFQRVFPARIAIPTPPSAR